jgi:DNA-3-methyladenine glycosylase II
MSSDLAAAYRKARLHLAKCDPVLKQIIAQVGSCTLQPNPAGFRVLMKSIISQMISTKAALSIGAKLEAALVPDGLTPAAVLAAGEERLRSVGLSRNKVAAMTDLAARAQSGELPLDRFPEMSDDEVSESLVAVRGIGPWTAHMFLMFSLGRLDVLPVDDFGLRAGVKKHYELTELPGRSALRERGEMWRPYRSVATWYFWRSLGSVPQSK